MGNDIDYHSNKKLGLVIPTVGSESRIQLPYKGKGTWAYGHLKREEKNCRVPWF